MTVKRNLGLLALIGALILSAAPAWADGDFYVVVAGGGMGAKINSLPYSISQPGFYYLGKNLTSTGDGIIVNASNVTIDLMGFTLSGPGKSILCGGIGPSATVSNIEVRNGTIRDFNVAVGYANHYHNDYRLINLRLIGNKAGVYLNGFNIVIKGCTIDDSDFGIHIPDGSGTISNNAINYHVVAGISVDAGIWNIIGNTMSNAASVLSMRDGSSIVGNTISCNSGQTGLVLPAPVSTNQRILVSQNTVTGDGTPKSVAHGGVTYVGNAGL